MQDKHIPCVLPGEGRITSTLSTFKNQTCHLTQREGQPSPSQEVSAGLLTSTGNIIFQKGVLDL